ncbi:hypothetical protein PTH_0649 [Pelotomaculum thermopropionicum SI]|uniref:DGC domain protein n=1 Tax=Pelotomaculum thermopropionicum (strain DSM 13744 / JCM 10971 / SI) TaxID=370438 RepID=A5D4L0_PELTS|nr:hypothetical protein PTH_0649 [Pelotomaculum thermopropionicum SI]
MYCLAGVGGHIESFIESSKGNRLVVIDGCPVSCVKKIFEHAELPVDVHIVVTGLGIKKEGSFQLHEEDIAKVCNEIKRQLK